MKTPLDGEFAELDREFRHSDEIEYINREANEKAKARLFVAVFIACLFAMFGAGLSMILWSPDAVAALAGALIAFPIGFFHAIYTIS